MQWTAACCTAYVNAYARLQTGIKEKQKKHIVSLGHAPSPVRPFQIMEVRCLSCGQGPEDFEKDLFPEQETRVHWERKGKDSQGLLHVKRELFELLGLWRCFFFNWKKTIWFDLIWLDYLNYILFYYITQK